MCYERPFHPGRLQGPDPQLAAVAASTVGGVPGTQCSRGLRAGSVCKPRLLPWDAGAKVAGALAAAVEPSHQARDCIHIADEVAPRAMMLHRAAAGSFVLAVVSTVVGTLV